MSELKDTIKEIQILTERHNIADIDAAINLCAARAHAKLYIRIEEALKRLIDREG